MDARDNSNNYAKYYTILHPLFNFRTLRYFSPSALAADQQETESKQSSYQHPLTLRIADDNNDSDTQPEYDYVNNDQQPVIVLKQCPAYRSTAQQ
jgi:hypothetical protein